MDLEPAICSRSLDQDGQQRELSDPSLYLPKQVEVAPGRYREYRQHRHRRRVEPETGRINWGESTGTAVPEPAHDTYTQVIHNYLAARIADNAASERDVAAWLAYADRLWHDPSLNGKEALIRLIAAVRAYYNPENRDVTEIPDA